MSIHTRNVMGPRATPFLTCDACGLSIEQGVFDDADAGWWVATLSANLVRKDLCSAACLKTFANNMMSSEREAAYVPQEWTV